MSGTKLFETIANMPIGTETQVTQTLMSAVISPVSFGSSQKRPREE